MEVHRFEKIWIAVSLLLIVGFIVTITYGAVGAGVAMVDDSGGTVDPTALSDHLGRIAIAPAGRKRLRWSAQVLRS